jgi:hypothetical protein
MKPYREVFFPMALRDPASFYQVLSNFTLLVRFLRPDTQRTRKPERYEDDEILLHHSQAIKLVRRKLEMEQRRRRGVRDDFGGFGVGVLCCE